ncbi:50S ribosomal protein L1 [Pantoea sp. Mhis]|uniref:50S ribosomal protein L1 n=1 Tax=Pantoea sp. Mhis TaxID=2576759 RepID=UPI0013575566|nr:50S ribosomal protein L1 [Pantoea sp. Mhis]MXP56514.1 50S ribosomal protein L1 [Pantoea sp. Mhis]
MVSMSKRMHVIRDKVNVFKQYDIKDAMMLLKEISIVKFIESVDVAISLNIDPRKSEQNLRGVTLLPHGTGRLVRVAVFAQGIHAESAKIAGAERVGMEDLAEDIKNNVIKFDVIIASPDAMHIVSQLGQILGPRGLMPNPKMGTVTTNVASSVRNIKSGQVSYRNDKNGIIHTTIGKLNFDINKIQENLEALLITLKKIKPISVKGLYFKKITISTTMGVGVAIDPCSLNIPLN